MLLLSFFTADLTSSIRHKSLIVFCTRKTAIFTKTKQMHLSRIYPLRHYKSLPQNCRDVILPTCIALKITEHIARSHCNLKSDPFLISLKPGFHIIVRIVRIALIVSKCVQAIGTIIWKCSKKIRTIRTIGTIAIARIASISIRAIGTIGNFCKRSNGNLLQTIETIGTIGTIQNCPRMQHVLPRFQNGGIT